MGLNEQERKEELERCARRLAAVFIVERFGGASVDYIYKKYLSQPIGRQWIRLAEIFLEIDINQSGNGPAEDIMGKVIMFKKPN